MTGEVIFIDILLSSRNNSYLHDGQKRLARVAEPSTYIQHFFKILSYCQVKGTTIPNFMFVHFVVFNIQRSVSEWYLHGFYTKQLNNKY